MKVPLLVGALFLPIDTGIVLITSPLRVTVSVLVLSSTRRDHLVADGEVRGDVLLAEQSVTQIDTVGVDRDLDGRARLPVMRLGANALHGCSTSRRRLRQAGWS